MTVPCEDLLLAYRLQEPLLKERIKELEQESDRRFHAMDMYAKELLETKEQRDRLATYIVNRCGLPEDQKDWACKQCHPESDILIDGFVCVYHEALASLETHPHTHEELMDGEE